MDLDSDKRELEKRNLSVWLDVARLGRQGLYADIAEGLKHTKVVVACISDEYAASANCTMEITHAMKNLRLPVIVCLVGITAGQKWTHTQVGMLVANCSYVLTMHDENDLQSNIS